MTESGRTLAELGLTARPPAASGLRVTGIAVDSRKVREGVLFAAMPGSRMHGAEFTDAVLRMGAAAILTDAAGARIAAPALARHPAAALIVAEDPREALARAAALWSGAQPGVMVAVTGTNGKTSVASFTRQIWTVLGHAAINIGTTGVEGAWHAPSPHTTPEPLTLHAMLAEAAAAGVTHAAMEASSHGLDQRRLDGVRLVAAGFTNLTQDHLDYHHTMEGYLAAKAGLFTRVLPDDGVAVVNLDDARGPEVAEICRRRGLRVLATGRAAGADLRILGQRPDETGQEVRFQWQGQPVQARMGLIGDFQAANVAVAAGLAIAAGDAPEAVFAALPRLETVWGRMQLVARRRNGAAVYVDYAHTPDAIATALRALRPHVMGRIVIVFGAGGDRDRGKRPLMGAAAAAGADVLYVTDDNPRSEDPAAIRAAVLEGCPEANEVGDRAEAILRGVDALQPGDALLIAGKGHESGQEIGGQVYPFDDAEQASVAVAALDGMI
ncbi:UDP-N-acetylmuramoyl-L-alanyl-D-glutamate--2,6-diaminopimelate ligase [Ruixingdingia sedimenti]|uniref:UDP-N-acetylmuramoyl-L-alanyl-D-glutamate--2,6-diaminopimelate ligase n=1 Tax=Ruixingdingia sedimenti TaxID=3073604 RepID=A0ABU1FB87_9RHOB|nr:UDP-N-acetylmuramoyl-L-alanyl-D-glutamate--2,6-diaminopimelate ligase [Xinfangfangia sp. LG-4]MDR5654115.1 UDP-N-acetylmuramoyl-L-alanyl-D-glutamate--2,6-diaminopimelate ligase [Xinfangfangia sp. LG-4]